MDSTILNSGSLTVKNQVQKTRRVCRPARTKVSSEENSDLCDAAWIKYLFNQITLENDAFTYTKQINNFYKQMQQKDICNFVPCTKTSF